MLLLPDFNAVLQPCPVSPAAFRAHAQGHFCDSCQRVVQDFSQSQNPVADLAAARAAAPDGRVCGSFRAAQVLAPPPPLTRRLKRFLVALVLVVGQGLTAREALAQVRRAVPQNLQTVTMPQNERATAPLLVDENPNKVYGAVVETMPAFRGGGQRELVHYIQQQIHWPQAAVRVCTGGRIFASFTVGTDGRVSGAHIVKSLHPLLDAEVLRVISRLSGFTPGQQDGRPTTVRFTVPITFKLK